MCLNVCMYISVLICVSLSENQTKKIDGEIERELVCLFVCKSFLVPVVHKITAQK